MEKDRSSKIIAIVALLIGIVGLSVGFAAFSNSLIIQSSLNVKPDASTFNVDFSSNQEELETDDIVPTHTGGVETYTNGKINNSGNPTISGLGATFTEPGQSVTYTFYAYNAGEYNAFLKSIIFGNANGSSSSYKLCTATTDQTTATYVASACNDISLKVTVNGVTATDASVPTVSNHKLDMKKGEQVTVTIEYKKVSGQQRADGDFKVEFGDITLSYSSVD